MRHASSSPAALAATGIVAIALTACGGGGSDAPATPATVDVATKVLDGAIRNALVCLDKNDNGACDAGEPSARSDAAGAATLLVAPDDAGRFALIALVGIDAVDADHGAVAQPFVLRAPADRSALITPLSTLVKAEADAAGLTTDEADRSLRELLGLDASLLADYGAAGSSAHATALARLARLVVLIKQQAAVELQPSEGTQDVSGATMTKDDLQRAVDHQVALRLQDLGAVLASDAVRNAGGAAQLDAALTAAATQLVASEVDFDPAVAIGVARLLATPPATPPAAPTGATANLRWFTYTDPANWSFRSFDSTAAQNVADANGHRHFADKRKRNVAGTVEVWGATPAYTMNNVYWNGTQWFACPADFEHPVTVPDANGDFSSRFCGAIVSKSRRGEQDISGRPLADVVQQIRTMGLPDAEGDYAFWGPSPSNPALAGLIFPANSKLYVYTRTDLVQPDAYTNVANNNNRVGNIFAPAVAAGDAVACAGTLTASVAATLDEMIARMTGTPCVYAPTAATGSRNEWWNQSTVSLGTIAGPAPAPALPFYNASRSLRASFGASQSVTYYACPMRAVNPQAWNCDAIGTGTYSIETQGDARVLRFAGLPPQAAALTYTRSFIERGGSVWLGFRTKPRHDYSQRLNAEATDALFAPLGVTR